jgi:hypothetical protein
MSRQPIGRLVVGVPAVALSLLALAPAPARGQQSVAASATTISVDPCLFASAAVLKMLIQTHINSQFPITEGGIRLWDPKVVAATCPQFRAEVRTDIRYKKTTGVPQYSTSGQVRFGSPIIARITYDPPLAPQNITKAEACLTDIQVLGLNLKRVPNWLDNGWVRSKVNENLQDGMCFVVLQQVAAHLQSGGTLQ